MPMLRLEYGDNVVEINPDVGAALTRFMHKGRDVVRPTPDGATDALMTANFPLVPFCNRIKDGTFIFEGKVISMAPNLGDHPHTLHGQGWRNGWEVAESTNFRALLRYHHLPDEWPWEYEATLLYELRNGGLRMTLNVKNLSATTMPCGLGFHPYFNRTRQTRIKAAVDGVWINTEDNLPRNRHAGVLVKNWPKGDLVDHDVLIDNCYTGFKQRVEIYEGDQSMLVLRASSDCKWLHIYAPVGEDFFCAEPVNHMPDPFNHPNSGLKVLKSGKSASVWMDLSLVG